jgi:hypothetical protein
MKRPYRIFAAVSDEASEGWIWFKDPSFPTRTIVKVRNPKTGRIVFCESRQIDANFVEGYNERPHTQNIEDNAEALVISAWYRDALGGFETTCQSKKQVELDITPARIRVEFGVWGSLRAACHQPNIAVRVGTRLGVLGAWLGLVALVPALLELIGLKAGCRVSSLILIAVAVGFAIPGYLVCRGVKHPEP